MEFNSFRQCCNTVWITQIGDEITMTFWTDKFDAEQAQIKRNSFLLHNFSDIDGNITTHQHGKSVTFNPFNLNFDGVFVLSDKEDLCVLKQFHNEWYAELKKQIQKWYNRESVELKNSDWMHPDYKKELVGIIDYLGQVSLI